MAETKKVAVPSIDSAETSAKYDGYTGVRIIVGTNDDGKQAECFAGSEDGRVLEVTNPFGTEQMAKDILKTVQGFKYQPLKVSGAMLNPAAEIGDGISANGVYSGIFKRYTTFGRLMKSDVEAPSEEEIDHEYVYEAKENREYSRFVSNTKSTLKLQAGEIAARVTREGGNSKSFGWTLTEDGFVLSSGSKEVFKADESGITVTGEIKATSGYIGSESSGFKITGSAIYKNMTSLSSTTTPGIYIGTDGISLGGGKFKVTSSGALYATTGTFTGSVYANQIQTGGDAGYVEYNQLSTYNQDGIGGGHNFSDMDAGYYTASYVSGYNVGGTYVSGYNVDGTYVSGYSVDGTYVSGTSVSGNTLSGDTWYDAYGTGHSVAWRSTSVARSGTVTLAVSNNTMYNIMLANGDTAYAYLLQGFQPALSLNLDYIDYLAVL